MVVGGKNIIKNEGQYIQYPGYGHAGHRAASSLYLAMLHGIGKPQKQFGKIDTQIENTVDLSEPLPEFVL